MRAGGRCLLAYVDDGVGDRQGGVDRVRLCAAGAAL